jgi:hypothetical protein
MDGLRIMQGYLMTQMRAQSLVAEQSVALGLVPHALVEARQAAEELGLGLPGHSHSLYMQLLGKPTRTLFRDDSDGVSERTDYYLVPPWDGFLVAVSSSAGGGTRGVSFTKLELGNPRPPRVGDLIPWSIVLDELSMADCTIVDEWYPMLDYACTIIGHGRQRAVLQFDFGLLQAVVWG